MKKIIFPVIAISACALLGITPVFSAHAETMRAYFSASADTVPLGSEVSVAILIDASQPVNAYAFKVSYPPQTLDFVTSDNSRSLIDVWQETPLLTNGSISFKGGSLSPFHGNHGELLTLTFRATQIGDAVLDFQNIALYMANGKGTRVIPEKLGITLHVVPQGSVNANKSPQRKIEDSMPPEVKFLAFIADPFNTHQKLMGFMVADVGSGVRTVSLRTRSWFLWSDFAPALNPTAVPTNIWTADLRVIDNQGNVYDKVIYDWNAFVRGPLVATVVSLLLVFGSAYFIKKKRHSP